ncbi:MAG: tetratricopeptide repeat protein, partial [Silvanigrellales bacterium]|nr:tetratricopeptide repeat protein [Silvanigrellales bacterium]
DAAEKALIRKDHRSAERDFKMALELKPESARANTGLARLSCDQGDRAGALELLSRAHTANANYLEAFRLELKIHMDAKDNLNVIRVAKQIHKMSPENPKYTMILAKAALEEGDMVTSEQYFRMTIALSPKLAAAYKGLGDVYMRTADFSRSRRYYLKALELDGEDISILNGLGTTSVRQGQYKEGIKYYLMALKLDARNPKVKFNLGHAYEKLGEFDQALYFLLAAINEDPNFEKAKLAILRIQQKKAV